MDKVKLSDEQERRLNELDSAAEEFLKVVADDKDYEPDRDTVIETVSSAADLLYSKGTKIYYPNVKRDKDGHVTSSDYYERDATASFNRLVTLILRDPDPDYPLGRLTMIGIRTSLSDDDIVPAIKAACQDFLNTPEGRKEWDYNCSNFNYGDFDSSVPNSFCIPHGFMKLNSSPEVLDLDFNEQLGYLDDEEDGEE